uniref:Secreted protein n=1 Tax=Strigamia maritima TaxID=126957 RepID=T1JG91_STRMM
MKNMTSLCNFLCLRRLLGSARLGSPIFVSFRFSLLFLNGTLTEQPRYLNVFKMTDDNMEFVIIFALKTWRPCSEYNCYVRFVIF